ncbi:MAG TPA: NAD-dependent epimerase/dehydratase family protein [Solirubrobacteraceae bacterium]|nr:NAD-dependent epimerase/dehydratase family protein [Solirubrobacteraceae bacterium]
MTNGSGLTVAVTGPTGDIGRALLRALDGSPEVKQVIGMARRPFDPQAAGLKKVAYRRGDVLDRAALEDLFSGADVVMHLAFVIFGSIDESRKVNLEGSRNVFEAAVAANAKRVVYASSVAAYGYHDDAPDLLTEDLEPRGTDAHYYSAQKAELEGVLAEVLAGSETEAYVFRPCIVSGPDALMLLENIPYVQLAGRLPEAVRRLFETIPIVKPVLPDPGVQFQLVHHDDVASAMLAGVLGHGEPGIYNLAASGELTMRDLADALGYYAVSVPELAVDATAEIVARLPFLPAEATWINAFRSPVLMDTAKARSKLSWRPAHDAQATLKQMVTAGRAERTVG